MFDPHCNWFNHYFGSPHDYLILHKDFDLMVFLKFIN